MRVACPESGKHIVRPPMTKIDMAVMIVEAIGIVAGLAIVIYGIGNLPETVPTHIGLSGVVDTYGDKWQLIDLSIITSVVSIIMFGLMTFVSRYPDIFKYFVKARKENVEESCRICQRMVQCFTMLLIWLFTIISFFITLVTPYDPDKSILIVVIIIPFVMVTDIVTLYFVARLMIVTGKYKPARNKIY